MSNFDAAWCILCLSLGGFFSRLFSGLWGLKELRILILGLDGAGKTTILYRLQVGEVVTTIPSKSWSDVLTVWMIRILFFQPSVSMWSLWRIRTWSSKVRNCNSALWLGVRNWSFNLSCMPWWPLTLGVYTGIINKGHWDTIEITFKWRTVLRYQMETFL